MATFSERQVAVSSQSPGESHVRLLDMLTRIAELAAAAIPGVDRAALTLSDARGHVEVVMAGNALAVELEPSSADNRLTLPLPTANGSTGTINLYARSELLDDTAETLAELFARAAAITVDNARLLVQLASSCARERVASRAVIDQALGVVMGHSNCTLAEAAEALQRLSRSTNRTCSEVARSILDEAGRRARGQQAPRRPNGARP